MIRKFTIALAAAAFLLPVMSYGQEIKVMSYNIRYGEGSDGTNSWQYRAPLTIEMLEDQAPDIFGVQEALGNQIDFILEFTDGYECVGVGRDDGKKEGEHMSVFWNKKKIKLLKWGTFWLSETPSEPSKGWDAACFRTATWTLMKDKKTGNKFFFVNTHLDHVGKEARKNGLALIVDKIAELNPEGFPMVLTGDFNIKPNDPALKDLDTRMESVRKIAAKTDNHHTYNGWGRASKDSVIDYIYVSGFSACPEYQTITKKYSGRTFVSDHYPIISRLVF